MKKSSLHAYLFLSLQFPLFLPEWQFSLLLPIPFVKQMTAARTDKQNRTEQQTKFGENIKLCSSQHKFNVFCEINAFLVFKLLIDK